MKIASVLCLSLLFLNSCDFRDVKGTQERDVDYYYRVTGNATNVTINYFGENGTTTDLVYSLPWQSQYLSHHIPADSSFGCIVEAINNTSDNVTITVEIYVDGELKATNTKTGSNCTVYMSYDVFP